MAVQLSVDASYPNGLEGAIADCTTAGRDANDPWPVLLLQEDVYPGETIGAANASLRGPGQVVQRCIIRPAAGRETVAIGDLDLDGTNYLGFHGTRHATAIQDGPTARTLPIHDDDGVTINAGIKLTPVVTNLPVPTLEVLNYVPKQANQSESLVVSVAGRRIVVSGVATGASKQVTTTAQAIIDAINGTPAAAALVTAAVADGQDGTGHVQDGFPEFQCSNVGWRELDIQEGTHDIDVVRCKLGVVRQREYTWNVRVSGCYHPLASFVWTCSVTEGSRRVYNTTLSRNWWAAGYNTDCVGPRPAHAVMFVADMNTCTRACDPEASSLHVDTFQPIFSSEWVRFTRNRLLYQSGQCFFMTNYRACDVLVENNLIHMDGETNLTCQAGAIFYGVFRHNTIIANGWLWDDADSPGEISNGLRVYNNIVKRFQRATGVPVFKGYNIVSESGTGWTPDATDTATLPTFLSPYHPDWDFRPADAAQPGVGDGTLEFMGHGTPLTDIRGRLRNPAVADQGCYATS